MGVIIITPVPFLEVKLALYKSSTAGIKKARVFPDPVLAAPKTSLPFNKWGMVLD